MPGSALPENAGHRRRLGRWRQQTALLHAALDPVAAEPVPARLKRVRAPVRARMIGRWLLPMAAAFLGIAIGVASGWRIWGGPEPTTARTIAEIGLSAHEVFIREVRHPVEVTVADATHLVNWLSNRLGVPIAPPDLTSNGLTLLGGRVVPNDGEPAAQLMYEDSGGRRFTLFIARTNEEATTAFRYAWAPEVCAYYWMEGTVAYVFAGPDDRDLMLQLSRQVYDQMN